MTAALFPQPRLHPALVAVLVLVALLGGLWGLSVTLSASSEDDPQQELARASTIEGNAMALQMALDTYAGEHGGTYPPTETWLTELLRDKALVGPLPNPYGRDGQTNSLGVAGSALAPATRRFLTPQGTLLGTGHRPHGGGYDALTYGALVYDRGPGPDGYVLYGIGRDGDRAVVVVSLRSAAK